jgi:hypothetical protein
MINGTKTSNKFKSVFIPNGPGCFHPHHESAKREPGAGPSVGKFRMGRCPRWRLSRNIRAKRKKR